MCTVSVPASLTEQKIARQVPAIVPDELWAQAQAALQRNFLFGKRNAKRQYLLRGLIKCGCCSLTYIGTASRTG